MNISASNFQKYIPSVLLAFLLVIGLTSIGMSEESPPTATLIVRTVPGLSVAQQEDVIQRNGGQVTSSIPQLRMYVIEVPESDVEAIALAYAEDPEVASVELDTTRKVEWLPNDELIGSQWHLPKIGWDAVYENTALDTGGSEPIVAVLDTGINAAHSDLASVVVPGMSVFDAESDGTSDPNGHGTWLAGIVAAQTDNGEGIAGVAYSGVKVMPVQVIAANGEGQDSDIIAGIIWAADHGADVILMGFSNPGFSENLQLAVDYAWSENVVLVASVGNDALTEPTYPAGDAGVMGVSATDFNDGLASFSNLGDAVFLAAPGVDITSTDGAGGYSSASGTSASAAIVAGVAGFMRAVDPSLPNSVIVGRIARNADPAGSEDPEEAALMVGNGRINMSRALADTSMEGVKPTGAPGGGPFVGPYVVAALNLVINGGPGVAWYKSGANITVSGTYTCSSPQCTTPTSVTVGVYATDSTNNTVTGSPELGPVAISSLSGGTWSTTFAAGGTSLTAGVKYDVQASFAFTGGSGTSPRVAVKDEIIGSDKTAPVTTATCNPAICSTDTATNVAVQLSDTDAESGVLNNGLAILYCVDTANTCTPGTGYPGNPGFNVAIAGTTKYVRFFSTDTAGNVESTKSKTIAFNAALPVVASTSPSNGATNVAVNSNITVTFSESVTNNTPPNPEGAFSLACPTGTPVAFTVSSSPSTSYTLDPSANLPGGTACTVTINKTKITDADGAEMAAQYSFSFTTEASNAAPVVTAEDDDTFSEGTSKSYSASWTDADSGQTHTCMIDFGDGGGPVAGTMSPAQPSDSGTCELNHTYADGPNNYTITVSVNDGTEPGSDTAAATVDNVAPTATFGNNGPVDEGSDIVLSLTSPSDPSSVDTTAGFTYAFDCGSGYGAFGSSTTSNCSTDDNGTRLVKGKIKDKDDDVTEYTASVTINNVAPTGTFNTPAAPVNEGSSFSLSISDVTDPSTLDTTAGFQYSFDCGDGIYTSWDSTANVSCSTATDGPSTLTVHGKVRDKDDGSNTYGGSVDVDNVAPTVTTLSLTSNSINEGGAATLGGSFTDPGVLDTHTVDIDWGDGTAHSTVNLAANVLTFSGATHTYADDNPTGTSSDDYTITVTVTDKDTGSDSETKIITVNNVAPAFTAEDAATNPTKFAIGASCAVGGADNVTLNYGFTDPGTDTWTIAIDWDNDNVFEESHPGLTTKTGSYSHLYATAGLHTAAIKVTDDDTGTSTVTRTVWVNYNLSSILQPVNDTGHGANPSVFKYGSTIPVKVEVTDCDGSHPSNLVLKLTTTVTSGTTPPGEIEVASTSAADSGNQMRFSDPLYNFNLASKSVTPDPSSSARLFVSLMNGTTVVQWTDALIGFKK